MDQDERLLKAQKKKENKVKYSAKGAKQKGFKKLSTLDRQLETIKYNAHTIGNLNKRDTVLFGDANTAGTIEYDAILDLAREGLKELVKLDVRFRQFEKNIFSQSSRNDNRMMMTKEDTAALDEHIESFLRLVSAYYLLMPAQQTLEWLIRRYRINEFNIDHLLMCTLPYHQSNSFAQLLSILRYQSDKKWKFLVVFRHNKVTITRDYFVGLVHKNTYFLDLVCSTIVKYEKHNTLSKTMISFFTALMVDAVSVVPNLTDQFNRSVLPCLNFSLKSKNLDLQLGSFMILSNIASKVQFSKDVFELLIRNTLLNYRTSITASFTFLLVLFQRQTFTSLSTNNLKLLISIPAIEEILLDLNSQNKSLDRMIALMILFLCDTFDIYEQSKPLLTLVIRDLPSTSRKLHQVVITRLLDRFINNFKLQEDDEEEEEEKQIDGDNNNNSKQKEEENINISKMELTIKEKIDCMSEIVHLIDPRLVQEVINASMGSSSSNTDQKKRITEFQEQVFAQRVISSSSATSLFLKLQSPVIENRLEGLITLQKQIESGASDIASFANVVEDRLADEVDSVTLAAWSLTKLETVVTPKSLVSAAASCLSLATLKEETRAKVISIVSSNQHLDESVANQLCQILLSHATFEENKDEKKKNIFIQALAKKVNNSNSFFHIPASVSSNIELVAALARNILSTPQSINLLKSIISNTTNNDATNDKIFIILAICHAIPSLKSKEEKVEYTNLLIDYLKLYMSSCLDNDSSAVDDIADITMEEICKEMSSNQHHLHALFFCIDVVIKSFTPIQSAQEFIKELQNINAMVSLPTDASQITVTQHLIAILSALFKLIFSAMSTSPKHSDNLESFLQQIINRYLNNHVVLIKFLSIFWSEEESVAIQESALSLCNCFLSSKIFKSHAMNQSILCLFLVPLISTSKSVREAASQCIKSIDLAVSNCLADDKKKAVVSKISLFVDESKLITMQPQLYSKLLSTLDDYSHELVMDHRFLSMLLPNVIMSSDNEEIVKEDRDAICRYIVTTPLVYESLASRASFWTVLSSVNDPLFLQSLSSYVQTLVDKYENDSTNFTGDQGRILTVMMAQLVQPDSLMGKKNTANVALLLRVLKLANGVKLANGSTYRVLDAVLPRINSNLFASLPARDQTSVITSVLDLLHSSADIECRQLASDTLHSIMIDASCIMSILNGGITSIARITAIMEAIKENALGIKNIMTLLKPTMAILKKVSTGKKETEEEGVEYCKQVTLTTVLAISEAFFAKDVEMFGELFDVSVVIGAVSGTTEVQTRNCALMLLARVATQCPAQVFAQFGPILEMVRSTLSKDDSATFRVLCSFLSDIVPAIVSSTGVKIASVFGLFLESFKEIAIEYRVPLFATMITSINYTKLDVLFAQMLIKKIGLLRRVTEREEVVAKLIAKPDVAEDSDQVITARNGVKREQTHLDAFNKFVDELCNGIPAISISKNIAQLAKLTTFISLESGALQQQQHDDEDEEMNGSVSLDKEVIAMITANSSKDNRLLQTMMLEFIDERLSATSYLENLSFKASKQEREDIEVTYLASFSNLLVLLRRTTEFTERVKSQESSSSTKGKEKFLKKVLQSIHKCMDKINQLLSVDGFVSTVSQLLNHSDAQVRRRSLVIFNDKITALKSQLSEAQIVRFLSLLDNFSKVIESTSETDTNKQTALLSFEILARNFAQQHSAKFLQQMPTIIRAIGHANHQVVSSSLICIATLCSELQAKTVPYIPQFFPVLLSTLIGSYVSNVDSETRALLQLSCVSSIEMMLKKISKFLSPYLPQLLNALLHPRLTQGSNGTKLFAQVRRVLSLITKNVEFRLLLPAMTSAYEFAVVSESDQSIICLFDFVGEISANLSPKDVALHHRSIFKFYLQGFEFRRRYQDRVANIDLIEEHIISSFIVLVLKLNENLFKPIFIKIIDWAIGQKDNKETTSPVANGKKKAANGTKKDHTEDDSNKNDIDNTIFFYKLVNAFVSNLKSIFVSYMAYFLDDSVRHLTEIKSSSPTIGDSTNGSKRKKSSTNTAVAVNGKMAAVTETSQEKLLCLVMSTLQKCMFHDHDGILDKQRFEVLMPALVGQLENLMGGTGNAPLEQQQPDNYTRRVEEYLAPCITQLAVTINQDLLWKPLNHAVLLKTRSSHSAVRYGALRVIDTLQRRMGDRLLVFLPETIPFISELLDDSVPEVEKMTQQVVKTIENHLGVEESISSYL